MKTLQELKNQYEVDKKIVQTITGGDLSMSLITTEGDDDMD